MVQEVLIIPGTGAQGRAVCPQILQKGFKVAALAQDPESEHAKKLAASGVRVRKGDLSSKPSLEAAMDGIHAVFFAPPAHPSDEIPHATNVVRAARAAGVKHFIYSSVARTGDHESFPGWRADYPLAWYWTNKAHCEDIVRSAGFETWTILRPAFFYQNFNMPVCKSMWRGLADEHELRAPWTPETTIDMIDVVDIGKFAAEALVDPVKFGGKEISLAGDTKTLSQLAELLSTLSGKTITPRYLSDDEVEQLVQEGYLAILSYVWHREVGYQVNFGAMEEYGIPVNTFEEALSRDGLGW